MTKRKVRESEVRISLNEVVEIGPSRLLGKAAEIFPVDERVNAKEVWSGRSCAVSYRANES